MRLVRWGLIGCGAAFIAVAAVVDLEFVQIYISEDGEVEPKHAAALQIVRLALALFGVGQIAAAAALPWISLTVMPFFNSLARTRWTILLVPFFLLALLLLYKMAVGLGDQIYGILAREDSVVEFTTAIIFLVCAWLFVSASRSAPSFINKWIRVYYLLLTLFCLFVSLEEISYGQRVFGFSTPSQLVAANTQNETNIHNIAPLSFIFFYIGPWSLGIFGASGWTLPWMHRWFGQRTLILFSLMLPPWYLSSWYMPYALFALYDYAFWGSLPLIEWQDSEVLEALLACGFLGFALHVRSTLQWIRSAKPVHFAGHSRAPENEEC